MGVSLAILLERATLFASALSSMGGPSGGEDVSGPVSARRIGGDPGRFLKKWMACSCMAGVTRDLSCITARLSEQHEQNVSIKDLIYGVDALDNQILR